MKQPESFDNARGTHGDQVTAQFTEVNRARRSIGLPDNLTQG